MNVPAPAPSSAALVPSSAALSGLVSPKIQRVLQLARTHLQMDVSYVAELTEERQYFRAAEGPIHTFGVSVGGSLARPDTYCQRMLDGRIPNAVPDVRAEPETSNLPITRHTGVGSYIGVPLRLSDGTLFGTLCCVDRNAEAIGPRDAGFLAMLADVLTEELDLQHETARQRAVFTELLAGNDLDIAFQPILDLADGHRIGVEALSRFPAAVGSPDTVYPAAHSVGLGTELEALAVRTALDVLRCIDAGQFLAVNLSPTAALDLEGRVLAGVDVDLSRLVVEITETVAVDGYLAFRESLAPLRESGLRLAIDDAGAGYASLRHIVELAPDIIKIDRSLIHGMSQDRSRRSAARAFVTLAEDLGACTIAEGIETPADLEAARMLGITAAQGYLLGRPSTDPADLDVVSSA